jgi:hypothetical protein
MLETENNRPAPSVAEADQLPLTPRQAWARRVGGCALAAVVAVLAVRAILFIFGAPNVARDKPARMSSRRANCGPGAGPAGLPPSGGVDGHLGATYDVCSGFEKNPWLVVDLGGRFALSKVIVYNRADCCWGLRDLPMVVEASDDDVHYEPVGRRTTPFTQDDPWSLGLSRVIARFVRVRVDAPAAEIVLSEVEVYGRPAGGT